ncbi:RNA 2'-phosphotransferase [Vibrio coralliirubri]|uniref:RNA 2'-phosphotransferase n=1 Tax=Vibrio coralliirubri TaxID=1516159 RepID=UPI002283DAC5|nr:RNA 2'-phosphotransferase [Vibrio coralliirubri]MCY9861378.1 RNA 2'-phosphotransferase [Vibrio coralliirubri]
MKISNKRLERVGRFLTFLLRHKPSAAGLKMCNQGWVSVNQLISNTQNNPKPLDVGELKEVVAFDDNARFALREGVDGLEIRCSQGHSGALGVDLGYEAITPPETLYHGYPEDLEPTLMNQGLKAMSRQHVHLTTNKQKAISSGKRYGIPKIMIIDAVAANQAGYRFYCADNGVWLADYVPPAFLVPMTTV